MAASVSQKTEKCRLSSATSLVMSTLVLCRFPSSTAHITSLLYLAAISVLAGMPEQLGLALFYIKELIIMCVNIT